ncbi:TetR/AcrR family transcriptional regulator [Candidatus Parcubacteria bacterium]|nr:TetR/AcrR family transcriptional regulator [Candidatus Parcubacteria bacterium]
MTTSQNSKIVSTKDLIIDTAEQLFAQFGYLGVSMMDIADSLGITKAALYYHFDSKEKIYLKVLDGAFKEFSETIQKVIGDENLSVEKRFRKTITTYLDFCLEKRDLAKLTMQKLSKNDDSIVDFIAELKVKIARQLEPTIKEFLIYKKQSRFVDSKIATYLLIGMLNAFILGEIVEGGKNWKSQDVLKQIERLFFK